MEDLIEKIGKNRVEMRQANASRESRATGRGKEKSALCPDVGAIGLHRSS